MTGGPNTVLQLAARVALRGIPVRIFSALADPDRKTDPLLKHAEALTGKQLTSAQICFAPARPGRDPFYIGPQDRFLATAWATAHLARKAAALTSHRRFAYLIQDFEPGFFAWSTDYALALETYGMDIHPIINEPTLASFLVAGRVGRFRDPQFADQTVSFWPAVDRDYFSPAPQSASKRRILFYARPRHRRFLYDIGLTALKRVADSGAFASGEWEIIAIGAKIPRITLAEGLVLRNEPWLKFSGYAELMRTADVVLSLMLSPHTSYPPLEAAACGAVVVTNTFGTKTAEALTQLSPDILAVEATPDAVAGALSHAVSLAEGGREKSDRLAVAGNWDDAIGPAVDGVCDFFTASK
jgi:hypothetical protein